MNSRGNGFPPIPEDLQPSSRDAIERVRARCKRGKRTVFVSGNFNILHPGHLRLLRFAKECGDCLVVGVLASSPGAYLPQALRIEGVQALQWVDFAFLLEDEPARFLRGLQPAVVVKGAEHEHLVNEEAEAVAAYGGKLLFGSGDISFSSVDLLQKEWQELNLSTIKAPRDFLARHRITEERALGILQDMKRLRVTVLGDTIVDEYITCDALGMSQEDPTIVVSPILQERFVGGAGIVAAHARNLGSGVNFFSVLGADPVAEYARTRLGEYGIQFHGYEDDSRPTTCKQRYRVSSKTLLRVSHLRQHDIPAAIRGRILADLAEVMAETDLLLFADFNYGCLPQPLIEGIREACESRGIMMAADSQSSSQMGDVSRFRGTRLLTPTEREARLAMQDHDSGLVVLAENLRVKAQAENVAVTLGEEGVLIQTGADERRTWRTDRLPALNVAPKDVAGAGDSFLTCAAMALAVGADIWEASYLGSLAAACQVGRVGNLPLTPEELAREITH